MGSLLVERVVVTHWAVRVAQELAEFRWRRITGDRDRATALLAQAKLDLALQGAFDWLNRLVPVATRVAGDGDELHNDSIGTMNRVVSLSPGAALLTA